MFSRRTDPDIPTETVKGPSLARGPAWIVGLVLSVFGLMMFFQAPGTPLSTAGFPDGDATGVSWLGFEINAWTAWLTTAAGVLVLMGAAQHLLARATSLIAGLGLGLMAIIALIDGDVLGLAAANGLDVIGWAIASGVLLLTALLPRLQRERPVPVTQQDLVAERDRARIAKREPVAEPVPDPVADPYREPVVESEHHRIADGEPVAADGPTPLTNEERERQAAEAPAGPGGVRSGPLRRTYQGEPAAQTDAEREAQAEAAEDPTRVR